MRAALITPERLLLFVSTLALAGWLAAGGFGEPDQARADDIVGAATVIDGDTIVINRMNICLAGIDAPEHGQTCTVNGAPWRCGDAATDWLRGFLSGREVACTQKGHDRYGRTLATCYAGGENLNAKIVQEGWALNFDRYTHDYDDDEERARRRGGGGYGVGISSHLGNGGGIIEQIARTD